MSVCVRKYGRGRREGRGIPRSGYGAMQVNATGPACVLKGRGLTSDVNLIRGGSPDFQLQAPAALRVVHAAQRGHAAHAAPVHVHLAA